LHSTYKFYNIDSRAYLALKTVFLFRMDKCDSKKNSSAKMSDDSNEKIGPVLPLFVQMNIRHEEPQAHWKETSR
jgi:hypothetical protein